MRNNAPPAWAIHPFIRIAPPFLFGICAGELRIASEAHAWTCAMISLTLWLAWSLLKPVKRWTWKQMTGVSIYLLLYATGLCCSLLHHAHLAPGRLLAGAIEKSLVVQVSEVNDTGNGTYQARASPVYGSKTTSGEFRSDILMHIDSVGSPTAPLPGDLFAIHALCRPIRNKGNPGEPDFVSIQAAKGLYYQAFLRKDDMLLLGHRHIATWDAAFLSMRQWVESVLHRNIRDEGAADLAATLLTGHRASMDQDLLRAYSNTGVVHVIAISGLHLGMIYALLLWLLRPVFRKMGWTPAVGLFVMPGLWAYALFTGASASVIRSAAMFTGMGLALAMGRKQFFLNGLGSSAMVLLACRPDWIFDIGFQLSYAALLSIALFQSRLRRVIHFSNPLASAIWDLVTVTLAAQVLTAPLVAWHFHRLPLLFLFSNLPVVPLSSMVLLLGILICFFAGLPAVAHALGAAAGFLIHIMNGQVKGIDAVPNASLTDLRPGATQVALLFAMIFLMRSATRKTWLRAGYLLWVLLTCYRLLGMREDMRIDRQRSLVVFQARRQSLYALVEGRNMLALFQPEKPMDSIWRNRCIMQAVAYFNCRPPTLVALMPGRSIGWSVGESVWMVKCLPGQNRITDLSGQTEVFVRNGYFANLRGDSTPVARDCFLVADASCPLWKIQRWKSSPEGVPSRFHSVPEQGAFVRNMNPPPGLLPDKPRTATTWKRRSNPH